MNNYQYSAKDKNGNTVAGLIEAASEQEAADLLHKKECVVISLTPARSRDLKNISARRIKIDELVVFTRQLSTLIDAGIPLVQAFGILGEQVENRSFKKIVWSVRQDIESGVNFSDALSRHPQVFSELFVNMARSGEVSGALPEVLDRLAVYLEKTASLIRKVRSSLVYPVVVIVMAILITAVLLLKVVPTFKGIFDILGGQLPLPTRILIVVSDILRNNFVSLLVFLAAAGFIFKKYASTKKGRYQFDAKKLALPVLGEILRKVSVAKFSRTLATLIKSGVPVMNALDIVARTADNKVIEEAIFNCRNSVREGESISRPLSRTGVFPPIVCRMVGVGEQTGQLEKMLSKIADFYDEQVDAMVSGLTSAIEPLVIVFLGTVIGGIVISLFLPIFKITQLIAK